MDYSVLFILGMLFIYIIAMSSIGKQCYDKNPAFKKEHPDNNEYLSWGVGLSVTGLVICIGIAAFKFYK